jgi:hypothetical protein
VLADRQHGIDRQPIAAEAERLGDRRIGCDRIRPGHLAGHVPVVGRRLIDVQAGDLEAGVGPLAIEEIRLQEVLEDDVCVVAIAQLGDDRRNLGPSPIRGDARGTSQRRGERGPADPQPRASKEFPAVEITSPTVALHS